MNAAAHLTRLLSETATLVAVNTMMADQLPTATNTRNLTNAIVQAAAKLHWTHSYGPDEVGQAFLDQHAWFNLVGPEGPFKSNQLRVSIGYWAKGVHYHEHRHAPEEIYCVLAGGATFRTAGRSAVHGEPGDLILHPLDAPHSLTMDRSGLLAIAFWRGVSLLRPSQFRAA